MWERGIGKTLKKKCVWAYINASLKQADIVMG